MASTEAQLPDFESLSLDSENQKNEQTYSAPSLAEVLSSYPVFKNICQYLDTSSFLAMRRVIRCLNYNFSAYSRVRWNINGRLKRFVNSPTGLRSQLGLYNAVISGSFALQFFDNVEWQESDLDIYIAYGSDGSDAQKLIDYLISKEGYENQFEETGQPYPMSNMVMLSSYIRKRPDGQTTRIQIIATDETPIYAILKSFATTAVLNLITWNKAFSLFPHPTFLHRKAYFLDDPTNYPVELRTQERHIDSFWAHVEKYTSRGWTIIPEATDHPIPSALQPTERHIGDAQTWTMALDLTDVETGSVPDTVLEHAYFSLYHNMPQFRIMATVLSSMVLKHQYIFSSPADGSDFCAYIRPILNGLVEAELKKLQDLDKEEFLTALARRNALAGIAVEDEPLWDYVQKEDLLLKPASWAFVDDQIPSLYRAWERGGLNPSPE